MSTLDGLAAITAFVIAITGLLRLPDARDQVERSAIAGLSTGMAASFFALHAAWASEQPLPNFALVSRTVALVLLVAAITFATRAWVLFWKLRKS